MRYLALIILTLFFCSCGNKDNSTIRTIDLLSPGGQQVTNLSEIADDIQYIPLETHPDALMKFVGSLKEGNDKFYINTVLELLCFDKTGKFLYKLAQQGRGPGEYIYLSDYDIMPEENQVIVLTRGKLNFYNETDTGFNLQKHLNLKIQPNYVDFFPDQDNILLSFTASTGENKYQCVGITHEGDTLFKRPNYYKFTRISKVVMGFNSDNIINKYDDKMRIKGFLNDTIFTINNDFKFVPYMVLNSGGKSITTDFLANVPAPDMSSGTSPTAAFLAISEILEVEKYLICRFYYQKGSTWILYDKNNDQIVQFDGKELLKDDISGGINIEPKFACNGLIYSWTDALKFKTHMSGDEFRNAEVKNPTRKTELEKLAESVKEDDNHLLIVITPKK
jgi:6-bladed beta-propeller